MNSRSRQVADLETSGKAGAVSGHSLGIVNQERRTAVDERSSPRFEHLYETYFDEVYAFCARRVGRDMADDATSEVFMVVWRRLDMADISMERAWLFGIARNVIRNLWRSSRRARRTAERVSSLRGPAPLEPDELSSHWGESTAISSLRLLGERDQEILMLSAWEGLSGDEIAHVIGIAPNAVHQRLHRAKKRLAASMNNETAGKGRGRDGRT